MLCVKYRGTFTWSLASMQLDIILSSVFAPVEYTRSLHAEKNINFDPLLLAWQNYKIAKLSPSPNSNFSWGLSWLFCQLIQPPSHPPTHTSLILHLYSNVKESCWYTYVDLQNVFEPNLNPVNSPLEQESEKWPN